ncbi:sigma factor [Candidatus Nephthysia bennettiae]|uniref:sigma-70 family RNA polymerase sigma factor n=1 Tax=Candidatus Nephthysia bennettiae TaxID=3127016 RepID=UPI0030C6EB83
MTIRGQDDPGQQPRGDTSPDREQAAGGDVKRGTSSSSGGRQASLVEAATKGDPQARESLVREQLGWVQQAAGQRAGRGLSEGDLVQEGSLGLMKAIEEFPASGRTDFEAFAREQVAEHMEQAIAQEDSAQEESRRLVQAAEDYQLAEFSLRRELGREATPAEIAAKLEWPQERTDAIAGMVVEARRRHDEDLLNYLDPEDLDLDGLLSGAEDAADHQAGQKGTNGGGPSPSQGSTSTEK